MFYERKVRLCMYAMGCRVTSTVLLLSCMLWHFLNDFVSEGTAFYNNQSPLFIRSTLIITNKPSPIISRYISSNPTMHVPTSMLRRFTHFICEQVSHTSLQPFSLHCLTNNWLLTVRIYNEIIDQKMTAAYGAQTPACK
jgi:hypothetical protein